MLVEDIPDEEEEVVMVPHNAGEEADKADP